jgi:hypothetical protein
MALRALSRSVLERFDTAILTLVSAKCQDMVFLRSYTAFKFKSISQLV